MGEREDRDRAVAAAQKALDDAKLAKSEAFTAEAYAKKDVPLDRGPLTAARGLWDNVTNGKGPMGLVSQDGTLGGAANEATSMALSPMASGGKPVVNAFSPSAPASKGGPQATTSAGGGNIQEGRDNDLLGAASAMNMENFWTQPSPGGKAPDRYEGQGPDYSGIGGPRGKSDYETSLIDAPKRMEDALVEGQKAMSARSDAVGKVYDQEAERAAQATAARQHQRVADQKNLEARQTKLDQATQFYTDDLADQGKFWTNPGNIISAIAFSLMPIFGNDPTAGAKLINQAIDRDMANRQHAAEGTLGALRSNLAGYHKLTEDRQAGDLLADSEARRVAANEVARISQKFESPISQANAKAAIADLQQRSGVARMEAYKAWVNSPAQKMNQQMHDARAKGFDGAYQDLSKGPAGVQQPGQTSMAASKGTSGGTPTIANTTGNQGGTVGGFSSPTIAAVANADPQAAFRAAMDGRIRGSADIAEIARRRIDAQANLEASKGPDAVRKKKFELVDGYKKEAAAQPELVKIQPRLAGISSMQSTIDMVKRSEAAAGRDPARFLDSARSYMPTDWVDRYEKFKMRTASATAPGSAAEYGQLKLQATQAFRQKMNAEVNSYIHANAGGAVSEQEAKRMDSVISSGSNLNEIDAFVHAQSTSAKREESAAMAKLTPEAALMYMQRMGQGGSFLANSEGRAEPVKGRTMPTLETPEQRPDTFAGPPR